MLSRVAEKIYWMARYVERTENSARLINVNTNLLLDLPKKVTLGWKPLIDISGSEELYNSLYKEVNERNVVKFLTGDKRNPGSMLNSVGMARENARTIRDILPREAWEHINHFFLHLKSELSSGIARSRRHEFLGEVIDDCQRLTGLLAGSMLHDAGYIFLRIGRNLERADMSTRIVDVQTLDTLPASEQDWAPYENIQLMSVLQSMSAYQSYRQKVQGPVKRVRVLNFLLKEVEFPRSYAHCAIEVCDALKILPRHQQPVNKCEIAVNLMRQADLINMDNETLHEFIDDLQLHLGEINTSIFNTYFDPAVIDSIRADSFLKTA